MNRIIRILFIILFCIFISSIDIFADESDSIFDINTLQGPNTIHIKRSNSKISIPEEVVFISGANTKNMLDSVGVKTNIENISIIAPKNQEQQFIIYYVYKPEGFVKANSLNEGFIAIYENHLLSRYGLRPEENMIKWFSKPSYNNNKKSLISLAHIESGEVNVVEGKAIFLGRKGYVSLSFISHEKSQKECIDIYNKIVDGFVYKDGNKYSEILEEKDSISNKSLEDIFIENPIDKEIVGTLTGKIIQNYFGKIDKPVANKQSYGADYLKILLQIAMVLIILKFCSKPVKDFVMGKMNIKKKYPNTGISKKEKEHITETKNNNDNKNLINNKKDEKLASFKDEYDIWD